MTFLPLCGIKAGKTEKNSSRIDPIGVYINPPWQAGFAVYVFDFGIRACYRHSFWESPAYGAIINKASVYGLLTSKPCAFFVFIVLPAKGFAQHFFFPGRLYHMKHHKHSPYKYKPPYACN